MEDNEKLIEEKTKDFPSPKSLKFFIPIWICLGLVILGLAGVIIYFLIFYK